MSITATPPAGPTGGAAPEDPGRPPGSRDGRRAAGLAAALVGALAVGGATWFVLGRGGEELPLATPTPLPAGTAPGRPPGPSAPPPSASAAAPEAPATGTGKNPFYALIEPSTGATDAAPAPGAAPGDVPGEPLPSASAPTGQPPAAVGVTITLETTTPSSRTAKVTVDDTPHTVKPGVAFAADFVLRHFHGQRCATFRYRGTSFDLCESDSRTV